jgi:hypothetical protein
MHFADVIKQFRILLTSKLSNREDRSQFIEVTMILLVGLLCGLFNPNQVALQSWASLPPSSTLLSDNSRLDSGESC